MTLFCISFIAAVLKPVLKDTFCTGYNRCNIFHSIKTARIRHALIPRKNSSSSVAAPRAIPKECQRVLDSRRSSGGL
ncbi:hypothetical protein MA16_Dca009735 [Dendrobium catenatum]|uniref:Secreted protein n=1 Tax=Dendrobium catenatum TaxID=906689 RepID=A0A2I0VQL8_9ASPA|nr:hypothetical protein MA16_Dca009735 [Dendrobium catenatum]